MPSLVAAAAALALALPTLHADAGGLNPDDIVQAEILPGWRTKSGTQMAALHLQLAAHWKTYWRVPGQSGIPPQFNWSGSGNLAGAKIHWPVPQVFMVNGLQSIGYSEELILPIEFTPARPGEPVLLRASIDLGVCSDICVPVTLELRADLGRGTTADPAITAALQSRPQTARAAGLTGITCQIEPIADGLRLTADIAIPSSGAVEVGVIELADPTIWVSEPVAERSGQTLRLTSDLVPGSGAPFMLDRSGVRLTILGTDRAVDLLGCPAG